MSSSIRCVLSLAAACSGGGAGGGGGAGAGFPGVWQYQEGSFSFVNCYSLSTTVPLAKSGFQIVEQAGGLVRINPDGCRFDLVQTSPSHASGVTGQECAVEGVDGTGRPMTTRYHLDTLLLELKPDDASQMIEVFGVHSVQSSSLGTYTCEITGTNTLDRAP